MTAAISLTGVFANARAQRRLEQEGEGERRRLQLDAAMKAGELLSGSPGQSPAPEVIASGLLALTKLDQEGLAVTLLVDLWTPENSRISPEVAILVIDAALESEKRSAQLVAAELLCRNAKRLDPCKSLHWSSALEGCWNAGFSTPTKLLIVQALLDTTLNHVAEESALRAVSVRLYGFWDSEDSQTADGRRVRGCVGKLMAAVAPQLETFGYRDFIQGNREVTLEQFCRAAASAETNPDGYLDQMSDRYARQLIEWARKCTEQSSAGTALPYLASAAWGSRPSAATEATARNGGGEAVRLQK